MDRTLDFGVGVLRRPRAADAEHITSICQDPAIQRFTRVPIPYTLADAERFIEATDERWRAGTPATFMVEVDGRVVANVGLVHLDVEDGWGEIGYWTAPDMRRRGITTAAVSRVCAWAFENVGLARLQLETASGNTGSQRVAQRLGFCKEGVRRSAAVLRATGGMPRERTDMTMWGLLPNDFESRK